MIKADIGDENGAATLEIKGTPSDIMADYAYIGAGIIQSFEEHGINREKAAAILCSALNTALNTRVSDEPDDEYYELETGDHFFYNDIEFVCLDITDSGDYFAITTDIQGERQFNELGGDGSNNWAKSDLCKWLNGEFYNKIFKPEHLVNTISDLTADNGDKEYGACCDFVTLLSCDQYREYREYVPRYQNWIWTLTPWSCSVGDANYVRNVNPSGALSINYATLSNGVAPVCTFNHEILTAHRQASDGRIALEEASEC